MRESENDSSEKFRAGQRAAISKVTNKAGSASPDQIIAMNVQRDYFTPAMADYNELVSAEHLCPRRLLPVFQSALRSSRRLADIDSAFNSYWIAAVANPLVQVYRYFGDRQPAELSDTHFFGRAPVEPLIRIFLDRCVGGNVRQRSRKGHHTMDPHSLPMARCVLGPQIAQTRLTKNRY